MEDRRWVKAAALSPVYLGWLLYPTGEWELTAGPVGISCPLSVLLNSAWHCVCFITPEEPEL